MAIATAAKEAAEAAFKLAPKQEEKPGRREHAVLTDIADAELERRLNELQNERLRRIEAKREELMEGAQHTWEKDQEEFLRLCHKIHDAGGFRESFIEAASKSNGAFSPNLMLVRDLPVSYLPEEIRPAGMTVVKKGRTGSAGARSALSEPPPSHGDGNVPVDDIIVGAVKSKAGKELTLEEVIFELSKDAVLGAYLKKEPKGLSRKVGGVAKRGLIKKLENGKYAAA